MNEKNYPLHPGQTHVHPDYVQIPESDYRALMSELAVLREMTAVNVNQKDATEIMTLTSEVKALREMNVKLQGDKAQLEDDVALLRKNNESLKESVATLETDIAMSQRWRKCSDVFPKADDGYVYVLWEDGLPDIGYIGAEDDVIETVRDRGEGHSIEWWKPLPKLPEEHG